MPEVNVTLTTVGVSNYAMKIKVQM